jgi:ribosomal protein S18 acetylase RimI-like enzyme
LIDDAELRRRRLASQRAFYRLSAPASPAGRTIELDGVTAAVIPAVPERSVFNAVTYDDSEAVIAALPGLAREYEEAGIEAWTVWVLHGDQRVADALKEAGHVLDATPEEMACLLDGAQRPDPDPLEDWTREGDIHDVATINDEAYPFEDGPFSRGWQKAPEVHLYVARVNGAPSACLLSHDHEGDCGVWAVAALTKARGRGLTTALLAHAMVDARERGCETTSLEATQLGRGVYERLGYKPLGALEMWERRTAAAA